MTDEQDQHLKRRYLLDRSQPFGILPTPWFWNDPENWRLVRWPFTILMLVLMVIMDILSLHPWLDAGIVVSVYFLAIGLLERYVRHQALKRRALAEAATSDPQLPPAPTSNGDA